MTGLVTKIVGLGFNDLCRQPRPFLVIVNVPVSQDLSEQGDGQLLRVLVKKILREYGCHQALVG